MRHLHPLALTLILSLSPASRLLADAPGCPPLEGLRSERVVIAGDQVVERQVECLYREDSETPWPVGRLIGVWQEGGLMHPATDLCTPLEQKGIDPAVGSTSTAAYVVISRIGVSTRGEEGDAWRAASVTLLEDLGRSALDCDAARRAVDETRSRFASFDVSLPMGGPIPPAASPSWIPEVVSDPTEAQEQERERLRERANELYYGQNGVTKDRDTAGRLYEECAALGSPGCMYSLGFMYMEGQGGKDDKRKGIGWLLAGAAREESRCLSDLGDRFLEGDGVPADSAKAVELYEAAASKNNRYGMYRLAELYEQGEAVPKDQARANQWYQKAAKRGHSASQKRLRALGLKW